MIYTSYFARAKKISNKENLVSIAVKTPPGFPGRKCFALMPDEEDLWRLKAGQISEQTYRLNYKQKLSELDPVNILSDYGENSIYCCYEGEDKFCHRHIMADWFRSHGYKVEEWQP